MTIYREPECIVLPVIREKHPQLENIVRDQTFDHTLGEFLTWGQVEFGVQDTLYHGKEGRHVRVAVIDSGISRHVDRAVNIVAAADFTGSNSIEDITGHGSHVAGIIAARRNSYGTVGVAPESDLLIARVFGYSKKTSTDRIVDAIYWSLDNGADVINLSLGQGHPDPQLEEAVEQATKEGAVVLAASGNTQEGSLNRMKYPAKSNHTIAVGSIKRKSDLWNRTIGYEPSRFSIGGIQLDFVAPGENILSISNCGPQGYALRSGTSMATPFLSGVAATVLGAAYHHAAYNTGKHSVLTSRIPQRSQAMKSVFMQYASKERIPLLKRGRVGHGYVRADRVFGIEGNNGYQRRLG